MKKLFEEAIEIIKSNMYMHYDHRYDIEEEFLKRVEAFEKENKPNNEVVEGPQGL